MPKMVIWDLVFVLLGFILSHLSGSTFLFCISSAYVDPLYPDLPPTLTSDSELRVSVALPESKLCTSLFDLH